MSMKQTCTPFELIRNLYKEMSASEVKAIEMALQSDVDLQEENGFLRDAYRQLPKVLFNPAPSTLQRILAYSALVVSC